MQANKDFENQLESCPLWEGENSVLEIMHLGTNMWRIVFYLKENGILHFTEVGIYKDIDKIKKLIVLLKAKPCSKTLVLRSTKDG